MKFGNGWDHLFLRKAVNSLERFSIRWTWNHTFALFWIMVKLKSVIIRLRMQFVRLWLVGRGGCSAILRKARQQAPPSTHWLKRQKRMGLILIVICCACWRSSPCMRGVRPRSKLKVSCLGIRKYRQLALFRNKSPHFLLSLSYWPLTPYSPADCHPVKTIDDRRQIYFSRQNKLAGFSKNSNFISHPDTVVVGYGRNWIERLQQIVETTHTWPNYPWKRGSNDFQWTKRDPCDH